MSIEQLIQNWRLNKILLAQKMNMPQSTFRNKANPELEQYHFSEAEREQLADVLSELGTDIEAAACSELA